MKTLYKVECWIVENDSGDLFIRYTVGNETREIGCDMLVDEHDLRCDLVVDKILDLMKRNLLAEFRKNFQE